MNVRDGVVHFDSGKVFLGAGDLGYVAIDPIFQGKLKDFRVFYSGNSTDHRLVVVPNLSDEEIEELAGFMLNWWSNIYSKYGEKLRLLREAETILNQAEAL